MTAIARDMLAHGDTERLDETLHRMETGFSRLDSLIEKIIQLTRTRLVVEEDESIALAPMVRDTLETLNYMDGFPLITFTVEIDAELTFVNKPSRVRVAIGNMLSNAIKYRDLQAAHPKVDIRAERVDGTVVVTIDDDGIGIEPGMRTNLFGMFVRLARPRRRERSRPLHRQEECRGHRGQRGLCATRQGQPLRACAA